MDQAAIELTGLSMDFGKGKSAITALDKLNASFPANTISGLVGPDAAGKSTLMRILSGLMLPTSGNALVFGKIAGSQTGKIGYMPQRFGLYEDLSVQANLRLQARLRGLDKETGEKRSERLLEFTGLRPFLKRLAGKLSGGMKQKLGIACALMGLPKLLLLDEPGVGVDPVSRRELWDMVSQLKNEGMTILWATSYLDEAQRFPHILLLESGKPLYQGAPEKLMDTAKGRVFLLPAKGGAADPGKAHREALLAWSALSGVMDALIQGADLRLTLGRDASANLYEKVHQEGGILTRPTLEDAYMTLVGGIGHAASPFATLFEARKEDRAGLDGKALIRAEDLTRKFGDFMAVHSVSLKVRAGEIFGLLGPNGAGKTTTFQMLCGLLRPSSGKCYVDGVNLLNSASQARSRLGYMAQKFSLYPDIKVKDNIQFWGKLYAMDKKAISESVDSLGGALELSEWMDKRTADLPAGLKQRLSLFCATMHNPPVLFLDEPTSGVDVRARREFWKHISAIANLGTAIMVTTHFMEEAEYCDRIALLYRGNVIREGSPDSLKKSVSGNPTLEEAFVESIEAYDRGHPL